MLLGITNGSTNFVNAKVRYKNSYSSFNYIAMPGDAITETNGWHGSGDSSWLFSYNPGFYGNWAALVRSTNGSIFSYYGMAHWNENPNNVSTGHSSKGHYSRAVVVQGADI